MMAYMLFFKEPALAVITLSREKLIITSKRYLHCISIDCVLSPTCALPSVPLSPIISSTGVFTDITKSHQIFLSEEVSRSSPQGSIRSKQICKAIASTVFEKKLIFMSRILGIHFNFRACFLQWKQSLQAWEPVQLFVPWVPYNYFRLRLK